MSGIQDALEAALRHRRDADELLLIADETAAAHLRWAGDALTTNGSVRSRRVTAVAVRDGAAGVHVGLVGHGGALGDALPGLVRAAERAARDAPPAADAARLPEPWRTPSWAEPPGGTSVDAFGDVLPGLADAFAAAGQRRLYGYTEHRVVTTYLAASTGARLRHAQSTGLFDLSVRDGDDSAWAGVTAPDLTGLDVPALAAELSATLARPGRRVELPPGRYEVLLTPNCVADLMLHLYLAAGARGALDGRTAFSRPDGRLPLGERLTALPLTLRSDPDHPLLPCAPFTVSRGTDDLTAVVDNGLPLRPTRWIDEGVLTALVQTRHTAEQTGAPLTPMVDNLVLEGGPDAPTLPEMVRSTRRGLLLTSLWYLRDVDPASLLLTGLTRDGVRLVEDGEIVGTVHNFRFNESPLSLLARATEAGRPVPALPREWGDYFTRMVMPPLRVPDFLMSAVSPAT
ncbi:MULTISPECIES: metallopeptidase TldD-related protein [Micromonospora]|uniref:metallopeptidase TldD-related protein n=1 Tax=Micromonospora TaxID=1873 RepID=UPI0007DB61A5|nr:MULTISPECIES: metallopeptidase TldD-related protein [unclassified Micromonospora]WBB82970.1 metallopeptidase TldD-related protein [Micromonospora sp. WMMC264]